MTRYAILIALLLCLPARGEAWQVVGGGAAVVDYCASSVCSGCTWQERFECGATAGDDDSDQERTWTYSSTGANTDDTYTPALSGSESLKLFALTNGAKATASLTGTDGDIYISVVIKPDAFTENNNQVVSLLVSGLAKVEFGMVYGAGPIITTTNAGVNAVYDSNTTDISNPTNARYWKFRYNNSSGSDGIFQVWHSDTGASGDWTLRHNVTTHVYTSQVTTLRIQSTTNNAYIFDDVRVSSSDINY